LVRYAAQSKKFAALGVPPASISELFRLLSPQNFRFACTIACNFAFAADDGAAFGRALPDG